MLGMHSSLGILILSGNYLSIAYNIIMCIDV